MQVTPFYTAGAAAQPYTIHVGATFTGTVNHLVFIADDDADASTDIEYSNIRLYEGADRPAYPLVFAGWSHSAYGGQDVSADLVVSNTAATAPAWAEVTHDAALSFINHHHREQRPVWFQDSAVAGGWRALGEGGDYVTFSPPLGASSTPGSVFGWAADGYLGIMPAGGFNFSRFAPSLLALAFQDYRVAETSGILSSTAANPPLWTAPSGFPTSNAYSALMPDPRRLIALRSSSWNGPFSISVGTRSGATGPFTWTKHELAITGDRASFIDPGYDASANEVVFVGNWRCSGDPAVLANWTDLAAPSTNKVSNVFAADFVTGTLYGVYNYKIGSGWSDLRYNLLTSTDRGATWTTRLSAVEGNVRSLAYDHVAKKLWIIAQQKNDVQTNALFAATHTGVATAPVYSAPVAISTTAVLPRETAHKDETGTRDIRPTVVEVDPFNPSIVYVGAARAFYRSDLHVIRSTDAGANWTVLNPTPANPVSATNVNGPEEINGLRVHPLTRDVWITGAMYGVWRIPAAVTATFWTDFGSFGNGAFPGGSGWTLFNNTTVLTPPSADFTIGAHPAGSGKGLAIAGAKRGIRRNFASVSGVVSWEFDVHLTAGSDTNRTLALGNSSAEAVRITTASGKFHYLDAYGAHILLLDASIANNTLYRFRVIADTVGQRADIYLDSGVGLRLRARQVPFRQSASTLDRMTFFNGWNTPQTMWLDNLRVETRAHGGL